MMFVLLSMVLTNCYTMNVPNTFVSINLSNSSENTELDNNLFNSNRNTENFSLINPLQRFVNEFKQASYAQATSNQHDILKRSLYYCVQLKLQESTCFPDPNITQFQQFWNEKYNQYFASWALSTTISQDVFNEEKSYIEKQFYYIRNKSRCLLGCGATLCALIMSGLLTGSVYLLEEI